MSGYTVTSAPIENSHQLEQDWCYLQARTECSYFQSWGWIGTWLDQVAGDLRPLVLQILLEGRLVGMGLLVERGMLRRRVFPSKALFLNEYPFDDRNMIMEYNGLLVERGSVGDVYRAVYEYFSKTGRTHDEVHFGAVTGEVVSSLKKVSAGTLNFAINEESRAWQVNLRGLEAGVDNYLASLSRNARGQVRRALRLYELQGPIEASEAESVGQAQAFLDRLKVMHEASWRSRGKSGAFANTRWENFHRTLIQNRFDKGEVQLLKFTHAGKELGYIYSHLWRKRVYMQQTGFRISGDNRLKPGYVAHVLAIQHNLKRGMDMYDFMYGDDRYKRTLSNRSEEIYWLVLQQRKLKFMLEDIATRAVRKIRT